MNEAAASVTAGTSQIEAAFEAANGAVESFEAALKSLENVAIFTVFAEGALKIKEMVSGINEDEVALLHMSERTGVAVSDLHGLGVAFEATGASSAMFERGMRMIEMRLEQAAMGTVSAQQKFAALGISWESLRGLSPEQVFFRVADAVSNMKDSTEKTEAVIGLLNSRFGTQLLPALNLGAAGFKQIIELENQLNPVTQQNAEDSAKLHTAWLSLGEGANSLARSIDHELNEALRGSITNILNLEGFVIELKTFLAEGGLTSWSLSGIAKAFDDGTAAGLKFVKTAEDLAGAIAKVGAAGQVAAPDVAKLIGEPSAKSEGPDPESVLLTSLEARQRAIKEEADSELAIWTEAAKNVETVEMSRFALEQAQIRAAASQHTITAQEETAELVALNQQELTSKLTTIDNEIAALQKAGVYEKDYYDKIAALQAQAAALTNQYAAKELEIQTQTATQSGNAWAKAFDNIGSDFNRLIDIMLAGGTKTETLGMKMAQFGGSMLEGAMSDIIKGISTKLGQAFANSTVVSGLETSLTTAWNAVKPVITNILGTTLSGALGLLGGTAAQAPTVAAQTALSASMTAATPPMIALSPALIGATPAMFALAGALTGAGIAAAVFEHGGIVPSAAGGMISGGGLSILHPREAVLPASITDGMIRAINGGTFGGGEGGGNNVNISFTINALDSTGVRQVLMANSDAVTQAVAKGMRNNHTTGQGFYRGNFRR